jgi:hypothetical protein
MNLSLNDLPPLGRNTNNAPKLVIQNPFEGGFVKGEKLEHKFNNNIKEVSDRNLVGELYLTNYKMFFKPNGFKYEECVRF